MKRAPAGLRYFEFHNVESNSHKFWAIHFTMAKGSLRPAGGIDTWLYWGRCNTAGQKKVFEFNGQADAQRDGMARVAGKMREGYKIATPPEDAVFMLDDLGYRTTDKRSNPMPVGFWDAAEKVARATPKPESADIIKAFGAAFRQAAEVPGYRWEPPPRNMMKWTSRLPEVRAVRDKFDLPKMEEDYEFIDPSKWPKDTIVQTQPLRVKPAPEPVVAVIATTRIIDFDED